MCEAQFTMEADLTKTLQALLLRQKVQAWVLRTGMLMSKTQV